MIFADVKGNVKQKETKELCIRSIREIQYKTGMHFSFNFASYSIQIDIFHLEQELGV